MYESEVSSDSENENRIKKEECNDRLFDIKEEETKQKLLIQAEELEADEFGLDKSSTKVWLVKIPKFVSEKWSRIEDPGVNLGKLRIYKKQKEDHTGKQLVPIVKLLLPDSISKLDGEIPGKYNLTITNMAPQKEHVFTESSQGKAVEISGTVHHEANVGPIVDDDYRRIMQQRTMHAASDSNSRSVLVLEGRASRVTDATRKNQWDTKPGLKASGHLDKKERISKEDLLDTLFAIFQEKQYHTLRELVKKTNQPVTWLREVLNEVAQFHRRGPMNGKFELKPEFRMGDNQDSNMTGEYPGDE